MRSKTDFSLQNKAFNFVDFPANQDNDKKENQKEQKSAQSR